MAAVTPVVVSDRDIEGLSVSHGFYVAIAANPGSPIVHDFRRLKSGTDRANRIKMRGCDAVGIGRTCQTGLYHRALGHN
jgi:hypothetical protein